MVADRVKLSSMLNRLLKRFLTAMTVVFLLFGPYVARILTRPTTRYHFMWQTGDAVYLLASMVSLALVCVLAGECVRRINRSLLTRVFNHLFVLALGAGILANLCAFGSEHFSLDYSTPFSRLEVQLAWLVLVTLVGISFWTGGTKLVSRSRLLCLIVSPTILLIATQLFLFRTYTVRRDALTPISEAVRTRLVEQPADSHSVYILVFDEWSYRQTFENHEVRPELVNLRALAARSIVFHDAKSPDEWTHGSMPRFLFQTDLPVVWCDGHEGFEEAGEFVRGRERVSLFKRPILERCRSYLLGFHIPYDAWLGDQVDTYRLYRWYERGESPVERYALQFLEASRYWTDPLSYVVNASVRLRVDDRYVLWLRESLKEDLLDVISQDRGDMVVVWHYPLPHFPFICDPEGHYRGPDEGAWQWDNLEGYRRNLAQMDKVLGEVIQAMKRNGRFDDTLIILTSDHNWRSDPDRRSHPNKKDSLTHVPLFVRVPGLAARHDVIDTFENRDLWRLIALAIEPDASEARQARLMQWVCGEDHSCDSLLAACSQPLDGCE